MHTHVRWSLLGKGCLAFAVVATFPAFGQEPAADSPVLEEIVVTGARGREERLLEVPVAVTAFDSHAIEAAGIEEVNDFLALTPNVNFTRSQSAGTNFLTVRGITQVRNSEPPVATVVDGVLEINPRQFNQTLVDIERIEVLRGPQGALYGRNATGGAILITTRAPSNELEGNVRAAAGRSEYQLGGSLSGPLVQDTLLFRLAAQYVDSDGLLYNPVLDDHMDYFEDATFRGKLLWMPSDAVEVDVRAGIVRTEGGGLNYIYQPAFVGADGKPVAFDFTRGDADVVDRNLYANNLGFNERDIDELAVKIEYRADWGTFRSVSSFSGVTEYLEGDQFPYTAATSVDFGVFPFADGTQTQYVDVEAVSQEFRIASPSDQPLRWMAGVYYLKTDRFISTTTGADLGLGITRIEHQPLFTDPVNPTLTYLADDNDNTASAVFGNVDFDVTDAVELSLALRYDRDEREQQVSPLSTAGAPGAVNERTYDHLQPKVSIRWLPGDDFNLYGSWGVGFRSGQFNQNGVGAAAESVGLVGVQDVVDQEITDTWEAGFKARAWNDRVSLDGALYRTDVDGQHYFVFVGEVGAQVLVGIDEVRLMGGELAATAHLADGFDAYASVGVTDSEIKAYALNPAAIGNKAPYVPDVTFNAGLQYRSAPVWQGFGLFARADYRHVGEQYWDPENSTDRSPLDLVDLRFGFENEESGWSLIGTWENVLDEVYNDEFVLGGFAQAAPPVTWRVDLRKSF